MSGVAIVLPPREAFSEDGAGAVAMIARAHARFGAHHAVVLGRAVARPFADAAFVAVTPQWRFGSAAIRYAGGVARALRAAPPALIEVHNRPDVALFLARRFPAVTLLLHNDPRGMRGARTLAQRQFLVRRLARVLAVSPWVRDRAGEGVGVLPNGIDLDEVPAAGLREPCILFAGRMVADKGADVFVAAMQAALPALPGWSAKMLGADRFGGDSPETPFLRALRPLAASAGVRLGGWQPHGRVLQAMAAAAIVVVPGRWPEPFGLVALEAMAAGAALVFVPHGSLPHLVGEAGIAVPPDAAAIAAAVVALARDPERRATLAAAGRERAAIFDMRVVAASLDAEREAALAAWSRPEADPIWLPRL